MPIFPSFVVLKTLNRPRQRPASISATCLSVFVPLDTKTFILLKISRGLQLFAPFSSMHTGVNCGSDCLSIGASFAAGYSQIRVLFRASHQLDLPSEGCMKIVRGACVYVHCSSPHDSPRCCLSCQSRIDPGYATETHPFSKIPVAFDPRKDSRPCQCHE